MSRRKIATSSPHIGELRTARERERADMLRYISDMTGELASIAGAARMPMLTYFLNMARVEAEMQLNEGHSSSMTSYGAR